MTDAEILELLDRYEGLLRELETGRQRRHGDGLGHLLTMIPKMRAMVTEYQGVKSYVHMVTEAILGHDGLPTFDSIAFIEADAAYGRQREKLMRWLGFMQGVFYVNDVYTIDEMRDHNRGPIPTE